MAIYFPLTLPIKILISARKTLTDTPKETFGQMIGHKINHHNNSFVLELALRMYEYAQQKSYKQNKDFLNEKILENQIYDKGLVSEIDKEFMYQHPKNTHIIQCLKEGRGHK